MTSNSKMLSSVVPCDGAGLGEEVQRRLGHGALVLKMFHGTQAPPTAHTGLVAVPSTFSAFWMPWMLR